MFKKKIVFLGLFCLAAALACVTWRHSLLCWGVKCYLNKQLPKGGKLSFEYQNAKIENGHLTFHGTTIKLEKEEKWPKVHLQMNDLKIAFGFQLFPFCIKPTITFDHPQIKIADKGRDAIPMGELFYYILGAYLFKIPIKIFCGELRFGEEVAFINFAYPEEGNRGRISLYKDEEGEGALPLSAIFSKEGHDLLFDISFADLDLAWICEISHHLFPMFNTELRVKGGKISGELSLALSYKAHHVDYMKYSIQLDDGFISHEKYGHQYQIKHLRAHSNMNNSPSVESVGRGEGRNTSPFEKFWPYLSGDVALEEINVRFDNLSSNNTWAVGDMKGNLSFDWGEGVPHLFLEGTLNNDEKGTLFRLEGKGAFEENACSYQMHIDIGALDEIQHPHAHLAIIPQGVDQFFFQTEFSHLDTNLLGIFHHLITMHFPKVGIANIDDGIFDGKVQGQMQQGKLKEFEIANLLAKNIRITLPHGKAGVVWSAQEMQGRGYFDLLTSNSKGFYWELDAVNGCVDIKDKRRMEGVNLHIAMKDKYIQPSLLTCYINGVRGELSCEGVYTHFNVNATLGLSPEKLSHLFGIAPGDMPGEWLSLKSNAHIKILQKTLEVEGAIDLFHGKAKGDNIQFGWNWNLDALAKGEIRKALHQGWFEAISLSDQTFNIPLICWGQHWRGRGRVDVKGKFDAYSVQLNIDPTHLLYTSPIIDLHPNIQGREEIPHCTFLFDFDKKSWSGKIPIEGARLREHRFGIESDSFSAEVYVEHSKIFCKNVEAHLHGTHIRAEVIVNHLVEEGLHELEVTTHQISGTTQEILKVFNSFSPHLIPNIPVEGRLTSNPGEMYLHAYIGKTNKLLEWRARFHLQKGQFPLSRALAFDNLTGDISYSTRDQMCKIEGARGELLLSRGERAMYTLNIPLLECNVTDGTWNYDLRLETQTHDICRVVGTTARESGEIHCILDREKTCFFGTKVDLSHLSLTEEGRLNRLHAQATFSALDLFHHVNFLSSSGLIPLNPTIIEEARIPRFDGGLLASFSFDLKEKRFDFEAKSNHLLCGPISLNHLAIQMKRRGDRLIIEQCELDSFAAKATMIARPHEWVIPQLEATWNNNQIKGKEGVYNLTNQKLKLPQISLKADLQELAKLFPQSKIDWSYITGELFANGELAVDLSKGVEQPSLNAVLALTGKNLGKGLLSLESSDKLYLSFDNTRGVAIERASFDILHPQLNLLWAKCHLDCLSYHHQEWRGENIVFIIPPEMMHFLGQTYSLPHCGYQNEQFILFDTPLRWDNQIETKVDFVAGNTAHIKGQLKEGYYWIGNKAWYLSDLIFTYENALLSLNFNTLFDAMPFNLDVHLSSPPHFASTITIQKPPKEEVSSPPLTIQTAWSEQQGYYIRNVEGHLCGLDFDLHYNPKHSLPDYIVLTGQLKTNLSSLAKLLPTPLQKKIKTFQIGKGYELNGDFILSKSTPANSHFTGYLKGKNFQFMGSVIETLMSEISISLDRIDLTNFNINDVAGTFKVEAINIHKKRGQGGQRWALTIPELIIQDFRPSLLKEFIWHPSETEAIGTYSPSHIKPFTIRELYFHNICGFLDDRESFTGEGQLNFINTFKREYNLFDIPFEILGRLGLDMGLLVPVQGALKFIMEEGHIYLTELKKSYSEGKRSKFFLSSTHPSYIDFDGNLNININMKQYVLLRFTEPFTLSIEGTLKKPKYGLK